MRVYVRVYMRMPTSKETALAVESIAIYNVISPDIIASTTFRFDLRSVARSQRIERFGGKINITSEW